MRRPSFSSKTCRTKKFPLLRPKVVLIQSTVNYVTDIDQIGVPSVSCKTFKNVRAHLREGGPFVFDMNTKYALKEYWGNGVKVFDKGKLLSIWKTTYNEKKMLSRLHITVFYRIGENTYSRMDEEHFERAYNNETVESLLKKAGFDEIKSFEHLSFSKPRENTPRVVFVAI